jgi:hypothetical protein
MFREKQFGGVGKKAHNTGVLGFRFHFQGLCFHLLSRTPLVVVVPVPFRLS